MTFNSTVALTRSSRANREVSPELLGIGGHQPRPAPRPITLAAGSCLARGGPFLGWSRPRDSPAWASEGLAAGVQRGAIGRTIPHSAPCGGRDCPGVCATADFLLRPPPFHPFPSTGVNPKGTPKVTLCFELHLRVLFLGNQPEVATQRQGTCSA